MTKRQAPQRHLPLSRAALLGLSAWCASALAANDIQIPCPELVAHSDTSLPVVLDKDVRAPALQRLEAATIVTLPPLAEDADETDPLRTATEPSADESTLRNNEIPDLATRLPGISPSEALRFRRNMLRTDI